MKRLLLILGGLLATILLLLVLAVVIITMVIDPNDYREDVETAVYDATGRSFQIEDELSLSFFPWLGVETGRIRMGNAEGFEGDFFSLDGADVRLRLIPLLRRQLDVAEIRVDGLRLNLAVNEDGVSNLDDLTEAQLPEAEELPDEEAEFDFAALEGLRIGGLRLSDMAISYRDEQAGMSAEIENASFRLGEIRLGEAIAFSTALDFRLSEPAMSGRFQGEGSLLADLAGDGSIRVANMDMQLDAESDLLPRSPLNFSLSWRSLLFDPEADRLELESLVGRADELPFMGDLTVSTLSETPRVSFELRSGDFNGAALMPWLGDELPEGFDLAGVDVVNWSFGGELDTAADTLDLSDGRFRLGDLSMDFAIGIRELSAETPEIEGSLSIDDFSPRALLSDMGIAALLPATQDPDVLNRFSLQAGIDQGGSGIALRDLDIWLDDSQIRGELRLPELDPLAMRFDLHIDAIDADRYLAPEDEDAPQPDESEPLDLDAIEIPVDAIRGQDLEGRLRIDQLVLAGMQIESLETGVRIRDDVLRLAPLDARLYGGRQRGELVVDASGEVPEIRFIESLDGVRIQGLLSDLFDIRDFTGGATITMELAGKGRTVGELRPTLDGRMSLLFQDGALEGTDLAHEFSQATARFRSDGAVRDDRGRTSFSTLSLSGTVSEGRLTSEDFGMRMESLALTGSGWLSLVDLSMDYRLAARLRDGSREDMASDEVDLKGRELSLRVTGTPISPRFRFDTDSLVRALRDEHTRESEERAREQAREAERRAREEADETRDRLRERLRERSGR